MPDSCPSTSMKGAFQLSNRARYSVCCLSAEAAFSSTGSFQEPIENGGGLSLSVISLCLSALWGIHRVKMEPPCKAADGSSLGEMNSADGGSWFLLRRLRYSSVPRIMKKTAINVPMTAPAIIPVWVVGLVMSVAGEDDSAGEDVAIGNDVDDVVDVEGDMGVVAGAAKVEDMMELLANVSDDAVVDILRCY
jgi:hypothetical protein